MNTDLQNIILFSGVIFALITISIHAYDLSVIMPAFFKRWFSDRQSTRDVAKELMIISNEYLTFSAQLELKIHNLKNPFLKTTMMTFISGSLRGPELIRALRERTESIFNRDLNQIKKIHQMSKTFPVLVWCITIFGVFGLINTSGNSGAIGYSDLIVYVALGLTIYGVSFNYFILNPTIDFLHKSANEDKQRNQMIIFGITLMQRHCDTFEAFEAINLYLVEGESIKWEDIFVEKNPIKNVA